MLVLSLKLWNLQKGNRAAEREFSVSEKVVRDWQKQKKDLLEQTSFLSKDGERTVKQRQNLQTVTVLHIILQALNMRPNPSFKASNGWTHRFMKRLCIRHRTKLSHKLPSDLEEKVSSFYKFVLRQRKQDEFELGQIGNMDETPMCFDLPGNRTIDHKAAKTIQIRTTGNEDPFHCSPGVYGKWTQIETNGDFQKKGHPKGRENVPLSAGSL